MKSIRVAAFVLVAAAGIAQAVGTNSPSIEVYVQAASFNWKEFDGGDELLEESGPLFGVGVRLHPDPLAMSLAFRAEGYAGDVDYDGQTFGGEPVEDTTEYTGARGELDLVVPVWIGKDRASTFNLFAGFGGDTWQRDLGTENPDTEYTEEWYSIGGRLGAGLFMLKNGLERGRLTGGLAIPFYTQNAVDIEDGNGTETLELEPEGQPGVFVEGSWRWGNLSATVFYAYQKYDASDGETVDIDFVGGTLPVEFFQPESERHLVGLDVGVVF